MQQSGHNVVLVLLNSRSLECPIPSLTIFYDEGGLVQFRLA
jgi:hypothetical protein